MSDEKPTPHDRVLPHGLIEIQPAYHLLTEKLAAQARDQIAAAFNRETTCVKLWMLAKLAVRFEPDPHKALGLIMWASGGSLNPLTVNEAVDAAIAHAKEMEAATKVEMHSSEDAIDHLVAHAKSIMQRED